MTTVCRRCAAGLVARRSIAADSWVELYDCGAVGRWGEGAAELQRCPRAAKDEEEARSGGIQGGSVKDEEEARSGGIQGGSVTPPARHQIAQRERLARRSVERQAAEAHKLLRLVQVYDDVVNALPPEQRVAFANALCARYRELNGLDMSEDR